MSVKLLGKNKSEIQDPGQKMSSTHEEKLLLLRTKDETIYNLSQ